jgi:hypothetical protein
MRDPHLPDAVHPAAGNRAGGRCVQVSSLWSREVVVRSVLRWVLGTVAVLALAGCGAGTAAGPDQAGAPNGTALPPGGAVEPADPVGLVGLWTVREAAGEEPGAILRLADREVSLWRRCGALFGAWRASPDGLFVAHFNGGSGACYTGPGDVPAWLSRAAGHRADGTARLLVDRDGATVARLVPGGRPKVDRYTSESLAEPPVVTDGLRRALGPVAALPAGLRPATAAELARRWVPADGAGDRAPRPPFAALAVDGRWTGSDGCNGQGGRWIAGEAGAFLAVAGAQTLIGCDGADVGGWLSDASRAGFAGDQLVLVDRSGREIARLRAG